MQNGETDKNRTRLSAWALAGAAAFCFAPAMAEAQPRSDSRAGQAALEARVKALEEALNTLKGELEAARERAAAADAASAQAAGQTGDKVIQLEAKTAELDKKVSAPPAEGMRLANGATLKIGGFVKAEALVSDFQDGIVAQDALLRDFYLPGQIPVGNQPSVGAQLNAHAKQTRIWLSLAQTSGAHKVGAYVEGDFQSAPGTQGTERTTNGFNFALRRAYATFDNWLVGQDWSTFQNTAALPETTDFIGPTEGTIFVRQPQVRYTHSLNKQATLQVALENSEAETMNAAGAITENDTDAAPDVVARLNLKPSFGEFSVAVLGRYLAVERPAAGLAPRLDDEAAGYGVSFAGKAPFGAKKQHDIRFMVNYGDGIGRYLGLNITPGAVERVVGGRASLETVGVVSGFGAMRLQLTPKTRSTLMYSMIQADAERGVYPLAATETAWSAAANLFYSPVPGFDLGVEYRHAERELFSGVEGAMDRVHAVAKKSF